MSTINAAMRARSRTTGRTQPKSELGGRELRRLLQLCVCVVVFLAIFVGKGAFPSHVAVLKENWMETMRETTDFQSAFADLGKAISEGVPVQNVLGDLWTEVFGGGTVELPDTKPQGAPTGEGRTAPVSVASVLSVLAPPRIETVVPAAAGHVDEPAVVPPHPEPTSHPYSGPALPERVSMDYQGFGLEETVTPVMGTVSSGYGYREHPVDGAYKFHYGTDIGAEEGEAVGSFADGVVDFIGESPAYGLYIQVRHDGGVTSFYAHCSKLCAGDGQRVSMGEKIAEVGDTGNATGPHLHFELKQDGVFYDPSYYIETQ
ncbi:MAG: M23 family metallopeptidase [Oscillospiraceae bacterium]